MLHPLCTSINQTFPETPLTHINNASILKHIHRSRHPILTIPDPKFRDIGPVVSEFREETSCVGPLCMCERARSGL